MSNSEQDKGFDKNRRLCPDGACLGVVGEDGRCKLCGHSASGAPDTSAPIPEPDHAEDTRPAEAAPEDPAASGAFDSQRRLCSDGLCLGVAGPDGRCNLCGRDTLEPAPSLGDKSP